MTGFSKLLTMRCPHCGGRMVTRHSVEVTPLVRDVRLRCGNDYCGFAAVGQLVLLRTLVPSIAPNAEITLPRANPNLQHFGKRPANDDMPRPDNDEHPPAADTAAPIVSG